MRRPLLVIDGDSFAHRAYHALPKSISRAGGRPGNALVGFTNMLLRLWQAERPRAVVVGWDVLDVPTYSQELHTGPDPEWWYLTPATGQHVSFYSRRTLETIADRLGMTLPIKDNDAWAVGRAIYRTGCGYQQSTPEPVGDRFRQ